MPPPMAAAAAAASSLLGIVGDGRLGDEDERGDRRGVLQRRAGDLDRVDDAHLEQVAVLAGGGVEALALGERP